MTEKVTEHILVFQFIIVVKALLIVMHSGEIFQQHLMIKLIAHHNGPILQILDQGGCVVGVAAVIPQDLFEDLLCGFCLSQGQQAVTLSRKALQNGRELGENRLVKIGRRSCAGFDLVHDDLTDCIVNANDGLWNLVFHIVDDSQLGQQQGIGADLFCQIVDADKKPVTFIRRTKQQEQIGAKIFDLVLFQRMELQDFRRLPIHFPQICILAVATSDKEGGGKGVGQIVILGGAEKRFLSFLGGNLVETVQNQQQMLRRQQTFETCHGKKVAVAAMAAELGVHFVENVMGIEQCSAR